MPSLRTVTLVAKKELLEALRDRRTLFVALVLPVLLYPLMMVAVGPLIGQQRQRLQEEVQPIAITGPGAEALAAHVLPDVPEPPPDADDDAEGPVRLELVEVADPEAALGSGEVALWIEAGAGVVDAVAGHGTGELTLHHDSSDDTSRIARGKWRDALYHARDRLVRTRLAGEGLPESFIEPLRIAETVDAASAEQRAGYAFGRMLALILVLMTLSSSFYPAVDVVAGEKERGTMETLLVAPCGRTELVLGKYLAVLAVTLTAAVLNLFSMWLTMGPLVGTMGVEGLEGLQISARALVGILALLVPLGALFAALSIGLSTLARSVKEAQHYLTPLFLFVMPLSMVVVIPNVELSPTLAAVPITNVVLFFRDLMVGKLEPWAAVTVLGTTVAVAGLALWATVRLFLREETLFRGPEGTGSLLSRPAGRPLPPAGAAILYFTVSIALVWYLQPLLPAENLLLNVLATQALVVALPCALLAWWLRLDLARTFRVRAPRWDVLALAVPIGLTMPVVNGFLQRHVIGEIPEEGPFHQLAEVFEKMITETPAALLVLLFAVLPALFEELAFRGFVMSGVWDQKRRTRPGAGAILGAAVLFALFHIYPEKWLGTFVVGAVLGVLAVAARSVWPAVLAHFLNNATLVLAGKVGDDHILRALHDAEHADHGTWLAVSAVVLVASLAATAVILRRGRDAGLASPAASSDAL
jgi:sodium transport system permease protein